MKIPLPSSEIIKRRLFRARERLQCLGGTGNVTVLTQIVRSSYEFNRALKLNAITAGSYSSIARATGDIIQNLTIVIDYDLTQVEVEPDQLEEAIKVAQAIMQAVQTIPLPSVPPARYP
jgi:hypothetical protein